MGLSCTPWGVDGEGRHRARRPRVACDVGLRRAHRVHPERQRHRGGEGPRAVSIGDRGAGDAAIDGDGDGGVWLGAPRDGRPRLGDAAHVHRRGDDGRCGHDGVLERVLGVDDGAARVGLRRADADLQRIGNGAGVDGAGERSGGAGRRRHDRAHGERDRACGGRAGAADDIGACVHRVDRGGHRDDDAGYRA